MSTTNILSKNTPNERRRTQIRLAQRAYRQRKETTISSLKQQNAQLQSIIEQMNKCFLRFNDSALKSGLLQLNPELARELKGITENFVTLVKTAVVEGHFKGDEEAAEADLDPAAELHKATETVRASREPRRIQQANPPPLPEHTDIGWGYSATLAEVPRLTHTASPQNKRYEPSTYFPPMPNSPFEAAKASSLVRTPPGALTVDQVLDQPRQRADTDVGNEPLPFGLVDIIMRDHPPYSPDPQIYSVNIPSPELTPPLTRLSTPPVFSSLTTKTMTSPWTYSFQETTFARRLTRAALEGGFHILSSANIRPAALNYVFRLSLPFMTIDQMREKFKLLLSRGTDEELDCWQTPFIHLGGAGTYYPRKDAEGNILRLPNSWNVRSIGPQKMIRAENAVDPSQSYDLEVDLTGFEGEWFDAYDVQGYLEKEKGCYINPRDTFAQVYIEVEDDTSAGLPSLSYSKDINLNLELPDPHSNYESRSPILSNASSSTDTISSQSTPGTGIAQLDPILAASTRSDTPFGLDMGVGNFNGFGKLNDIDTAAMFEQPLGLDLAPWFDPNLVTTMAGFGNSFGDIANLGMDLMGSEVEPIPIVKQKQKKAVCVDVSKLVDEIVKHAVCLGRAPGFRRKDIDMAFKASLVHF
ncbi:hypothetical protein K469DRAFT_224161 [Zopfia rhizophila CBS 207.26]|uniref:BZIP domain-containing protein n=1 Tax=Zopfia rhizophila CBS 207.26 TaxID=1314779 RepID=A0A6A6DU01_9PEZI|nr:hypothetical protein K469DRAFT_224161 [Zopfia rhizophila CBS 207.26]